MSERYRLIQDGIAVAEVEGDGAEREILHYAAMYSQDGPVFIEKRVGRKWASYGLNTDFITPHLTPFLEFILSGRVR